MSPRLILLGLLGAAVGGQLNRAIYRWAWNARNISPWCARPPKSPRRTWADCIPIFGWWRLRREHSLHGRGFWIRPMLIELFCCLGLPALYAWQTSGGQLPPDGPLAATILPTLQANFMSHAILFALMIVATFIDIDEKTIPDMITIPGTLIALLLAMNLPTSLLPTVAIPGQITPILLTTPLAWQPDLQRGTGLALGLACWVGWCYGLLPKTIYWRRGVLQGVRFLVASITRHPFSLWFTVLCLIGIGVITSAWQSGGIAWQALLSSLVGLGFGGGIVWAIRIVAGYAMGREAMGFGDVTLMAMIGAFLGWQAAMLTFFLAPFTSLGLALAQWVITRRHDIPFGPFLCAAASIVILAWGTIWTRWGPAFELGLLIPAIVATSIVLMGIVLGLLQLVKRLF